MPFKLTITKEDEPEWHQEYTYDKDTITIGRDINSDLQLEGTKSVVSRHHAQIKLQGDVYQVQDLNSRNFTFLNDDKVKAGADYTLSDGDVIRVCDFHMQFSTIEQEKARYADQTILDYPNPFLQDVVQLSTVLKQISTKYDQEDTDRKEEALQEAFQELVANLQAHKVLESLGQALQPGRPIAPPPTEDLGERFELSVSEEQGLMDMLLDFFVKMIQARRQFRMEFIGETMIKSAKTFSIYSCTPEELKAFIFDPSISLEESGRRKALLKGLVDELKLHQISLLDGYKSSVSSGSRQLIERFDPEAIKKLMSGKKSPLAGLKFLLPLFSAMKVVDQYAGVHRELAQEDQSIIEKKYYRPSYVKRYNHCMEMTLQDDTPNPESAGEGSDD